MKNTNLQFEIEMLIYSEKEGDYWDFKREYNDNKSDLLHDIICMANNRADRDAYIIYGVEDETYKIIGVENNPNRKNQQKIIDFLKDKEFAGGVRPQVELRTLRINNHEVDVLIIKNSKDTPYYLTKRFDKVAAYNIYTRVVDTNTPIDKSADINHVEYLWKKRFLLNRPPLEQITRRLTNAEEWQSKDEVIYFNIYNPEFTIAMEYDDRRNEPEYYAYTMENSSSIYDNIKIKLHGTVLDSYIGVSLNNAKLYVVNPKQEFLELNDGNSKMDLMFHYYIKGSLRYILNEFFFEKMENQEYCSKKNLYEVVLIFIDEIEKQNFKKYIKLNSIDIATYIEKIDYSPICIELYGRRDEERIMKYLETGKALNIILKEFRKIVKGEDDI